MSFTPATDQVIAEALGDTAEIPADMQAAITRQLTESFQAMSRPGRSDWLAQHSEKGQSMASFERTSFKALPHSTFKTIYIQPVGSFDHPRSAPLDVILQFARVFFSGCDVELLPTVDFTDDMKHRIGQTGENQYLTEGFYTYMNKTRSQRDTRRELLCVAVTMADIYPGEEWNFVYGQARVVDGVGVYSFARLDPLFFEPRKVQRTTPLSAEHRTIMLRRCVKILLHEVGHLFGLKHCIYYVCLMNGANHEIEMDRQPLHLCPVCLRKLYSTLKFDVREMYKQFVGLCEQYKLEEETIWYRKRLEYIEKSEQ